DLSHTEIYTLSLHDALPILDKWKLGDYFSCAVTPEQVAEFKPSPQPYLKAIEEFHLKPRDCFVIGDEPVDMMGGKRAGTKTIGLDRKSTRLNSSHVSISYAV